jgi:hypothetical protein
MAASNRAATCARSETSAAIRPTYSGDPCRASRSTSQVKTYAPSPTNASTIPRPIRTHPPASFRWSSSCSSSWACRSSKTALRPTRPSAVGFLLSHGRTHRHAPLRPRGWWHSRLPCRDVSASSTGTGWAAPRQARRAAGPAFPANTRTRDPRGGPPGRQTRVHRSAPERRRNRAGPPEPRRVVGRTGPGGLGRLEREGPTRCARRTMACGDNAHTVPHVTAGGFAD